MDWIAIQFKKGWCFRVKSGSNLRKYPLMMSSDLRGSLCYKLGMWSLKDILQTGRAGKNEALELNYVESSDKR